jgi:hypothetical protein
MLVRTQVGDDRGVRTREICNIESFGHNCVNHSAGGASSVRGSTYEQAVRRAGTRALFAVTRAIC